MQSFSDIELNRPESPEWDRLQGQVLDSTYEIWEFLHTDDHRAIFRATSLRRTRTAGDEGAGEYFVILERADAPGAAVRLNRYREASFLRDVNLLRVFHAGCAQLAGQDYIYVVTERAEYSLSDFQKDRGSLTDELAELTQQLIGGLSHLHAENLVYCALKAESVWRAGAQWKLADYSQLRVSGQHDEHLDLAADGAAASLPPEAGQVEVSPAWDVWALGLLIERLAANTTAGSVNGAVKTMTANGGGHSSVTLPVIPEPFAQIVTGALANDPDQRLSFGEISYRLNTLAPKPVRDLATRPIAKPAEESKPASPYSLVNPTGAGTGLVGYALLSREELEARRLANEPALLDDDPPRRSPLLKAFLLAFLIAAIPAGGYFAWTAWGAEIRAALHLSPDRNNPAQASADNQRFNSSFADAPAPPPMAPGGTGLTSASGPATAAAVLNLLDQWKEAARTHNVDQVMACYAPTLDRYFMRKDVTSDALRTIKEEELKQPVNRNGFDIYRLHFLSVTPDRVRVSFDRSVPNARRRPWVSHEEAVLTKFAGQWRISSEGRNVN